MNETGGERPPLTGIERIYKENLYANLRFPQSKVAIDVFTLHGLLADSNPTVLARQFFTEALSDELAEKMLEKARRAHAAFLVEDAIPTLDTQRIGRLWKSAQYKVERALLYVLDEEEPHEKETGEPVDYETQTEYLLEVLDRKKLPLPELRAATQAFVNAFKQPEITELLTKYRALMSSEYINKEGDEQEELFDSIVTLGKGISEKLFSLAIAETEKNPDLNKEILERVFNAFRYNV